MSEPQGRARTFVVLGIVAAFVLMGVAVVVAVTTAPTSPPASLDSADPGSSPPRSAGTAPDEIVPGSEDGSAPTAAEMAMARALIDFARDPSAPSLEQVPFAAEGVWLGLSDELIVRRTAAELGDPSAWRLNRGEFRARVGPFSAVELLADWDLGSGAPHVRQVVAAIGEHTHCASPPVPHPAPMAAMRRLSIQPFQPASCLTWWTVDLFIGPEGAIEAITLDLYEP